MRSSTAMRYGNLHLNEGGKAYTRSTVKFPGPRLAGNLRAISPHPLETSNCGGIVPTIFQYLYQYPQNANAGRGQLPWTRGLFQRYHADCYSGWVTYARMRLCGPTRDRVWCPFQSRRLHCCVLCNNLHSRKITHFIYVPFNNEPTSP